MSPDQTYILQTIERRIVNLRDEKRALTRMGLVVEAAMIENVLQSLEQMHTDHFDKCGPVVEFKRPQQDSNSPLLSHGQSLAAVILIAAGFFSAFAAG